ncbi:MAG: class I SAM-dependent methyltransferase [Pseudomonadota bacterium]
MAIIRWSRRVFRTLPDPIRHNRYIQALKDAIIARLSHDVIYDQDYYNHVETWAAESAPAIVDSITRDFGPKSVADVGCGTGAMLERVSRAGLVTKGFEYSDDGIKRCRHRGLDVQKFDIEADTYNDDTRFDVVMSMEVAEHLPESIADNYVQLLCDLSDTVVMTAASPGQIGTDHVNLQPKSYWIEKMTARGYTHLPQLQQSWQDKWKAAGVTRFYWQNLLLFQKGNSA